jgi:hypothetical protein
MEKRTSCTPSQTEGSIDITIEDVNTENEEIIFTQTIERKADSCNAPAIKAFYQVTDFSQPLIDEYELTKTVDISCNDARKEIAVNTITIYEDQIGGSEPVVEYYEKPAPAVIPNATLAELEALTKTPEEIEAELAALEPEASDDDIVVCNEIEENPSETAFFFTGCENKGPGVGVLSFKKFDTTGLKINNNGTVSYSLNATTQEFKSEIDTDSNGNNMDSFSATMMGIEMRYVFVSPWPILEHSAGQLTDEYTLVIDLMTQNDADNVTVTLDTDGATLDLVTPKTQLQIDNLIASLEEKNRQLED